MQNDCQMLLFYMVVFFWQFICKQLTFRKDHGNFILSHIDCCGQIDEK